MAENIEFRAEVDSPPKGKMIKTGTYQGWVKINGTKFHVSDTWYHTAGRSVYDKDSGSYLKRQHQNPASTHWYRLGG